MANIRISDIFRLAVAMVLSCVCGVIASAQGTVFVAQDGTGDFNGDTESPIARAIDAVRNGGTVNIQSGTYTIWRTLSLDGCDDVTIRGSDGVVLRLPLLPSSVVTIGVEAGERELTIRDPDCFLPNTRVRIKAPGRTDMHHGKPVVIPTFDVAIAEVNGTKLTLAEPLPYPVPNGAPIAFAENLFALTRGTNIALENLVLDGSMADDDPDFVGHVTLCGLWANGPYDYEDGLVGEPIRGLQIRDCTFRDFRGRCIAFYAVADSAVTNCKIENSPDAGINIDHFCTDIQVEDCRIARCGTGVELNDASQCTISNNRITDCGRGILVWRWCEGEALNRDNRIVGNTIEDSERAGIVLDVRTEANTVLDNRIHGNGGVGIAVKGDDTVVTANQVTGLGANSILATGNGNRVEGNVVAEESESLVEEGAE